MIILALDNTISRSGCSACDGFMSEYLDTAADLLMWEPHISMGLMDCSNSGRRTCNKVRSIDSLFLHYTWNLSDVIT